MHSPTPSTLTEGLFNKLPAGCLLLSKGGQIVDCNSVLAAWLDTEVAEVVGKKFVDLLPMGGKLYYANTHRVQESIEGSVEEVSYDLRRADGKTLPVLLTSQTLDSGHLLYLVYRAEMRRRYEVQLLEAKKLAEEINRTRATFFNTITHEVRTPIHAILGIAELLTETDLSEDQRRLIEVLQSSGTGLLELINDVLDLSRADASKLTLNLRPTELSSLLDAVLASLRPTVSSPSVKLESVIGIGCPTHVLLDSGKLRQVLTNLVSNAIRFTPAGHVRIQVVCRGPIDNNDERVVLAISVEDTGEGIPERDLTRIFQPFSQAHGNRSGVGTGLGLPISKRIVEAMGGELTVSSEVGQGSVFSFDLTVSPRTSSTERVALNEVAVTSAEQVRFHGARILVVDDNPTNRFIARRHLKVLGASVDECEGGEEAVSLAKEQTFDLILLDLRMPVMDGYQVAAVLRDMPHHATTPIIAVTAASFPEQRSSTEERLFNERLLKPFTFQQLATALGRYLTPSNEDVPARAKRRRKQTSAAPNVRLEEIPATVQLSLDRLREDFSQGDETGELIDLLQIMTRDLEAEQQALTQAARDADIPVLRDRRHKLNSILMLIKPEPLNQLLSLAIDPDAAIDRAALSEKLDQSIQGTVQALRGEIERLG